MMTSEMNQDPGAPAPASQVADAIDRLRQTAEEIEALVMAIENRMSCVTRDAASEPGKPGTEKGNPEPDPQPVVALAGWLGGINSDFRSLSKRLASLLDKCEL